MKRSFFQFICWTSYTLLCFFVRCDGFVLDWGSQYNKIPDTFQGFANGFGYKKMNGSQASVSVDSNGEIVAHTQQFGGADATGETATITRDNNGVTVVNNEQYENGGAVVVQSEGTGGSATVVIGSPAGGQKNVTNNQLTGEVAVGLSAAPETAQVEESIIVQQPEGVEVTNVENAPPTGIQSHKDSETVDPDKTVEDVVQEVDQEMEIISRHSPGVVCHYQVASLFTYHEDYMVKPEYINLTYCNTLLVSYAVLNYDTFAIQAYSLEEEAIFLRLSERKTGALKVILEFETMAFYENMEYLLTSADNIRTFVASTVSFLLAFGFDGLQLPAMIPNNMADENADYSYIKDGYLSLVQELGGAFYDHNLYLSVALPRQPEYINMGYNLPEMSDYVDWFFLMSLDYNNNDSSGNLMHTAPLTGETLGDSSSVDYSVNFLLRELLIPPYLIVMALPLYGSSFVLQDNSKRYFGTEYIDLGPPGLGAHVRGILTISELCSLKYTNWLSDPSIITDYEDVPELVRKVLYARTKHLGGVGIMSITMDDQSGNLCNLGSMPFTAAIFKSFNANSMLFPQNALISLADYIDPSTTNKYFG